MAVIGRDICVLNMDDMRAVLRALPDPFSNEPRSTGVNSSLAPHFNYKNLPLPPAHRVEQGGIGFSAVEPIGTEHVANCIGIIVRDPSTARTALAHYDDTSTPESLSQIFDAMPQGHPMDVVLIGAKYGPECENNDYARQSSENNLRNVMSFLAGKDINIIAARINDPQQPHAFAVHPQSFSIQPTENLIPHPLQEYAFARKFLGNGEPQPMAIEFDLPKSPSRNLYELGNEQVSNLETRIRGHDVETIAKWYREKGAFGGFEYKMAELSQSYLKAFDDGGCFRIQDSITDKVTPFSPIKNSIHFPNY